MADIGSSNYAYTELRRRLLAGEFPPGSRIREVELAEQLNVSRTPVRQALLRLCTEGLLDARPGRGVEVPAWTVDELDDVYELRAVLEAWGAARAARRHHLLDVEGLQKLADEMTAEGGKDSPDLDLLAELNIEFHQKVLDAAGSSRLVSAFSRVVHVPLMYKIFHIYTRTELDTTLREHHVLMEALRCGDPGWAESVQRAHIFAARAVVTGRLAADEASLGGLERPVVGMHAETERR